jgi:hypothetical protein
MRKGELTARQTKFVEAMVATGGHNHKKCARLAGFRGSEANLRNHAYQLLKLPKILDAIVERTRIEGNTILPAVMRNMVRIATDPEHGQSVRAGLALLGMFGLSPITKSEHHVEHVPDISAIERLRALVGQLQPLLAPPVINVTPAATTSAGAHEGPRGCKT